MEKMHRSSNFANFEKKCLNNDAFRAWFVVNPEKAIQSPPPVGLGIDLSGPAREELIQLIQDYLGSANMIVVEKPDVYDRLKAEVRKKYPNEPMGAI